MPGQSSRQDPSNFFMGNYPNSFVNGLHHRDGKRFSKSFLQRADEACFFEAYVGASLARNGLYVIHQPMGLGLYHDPLKSLSWDLEVAANGMLDPVLPLECKSRSVGFSGPEDYPHQDVRVCSQKWFLKNWPGSDTLGRDFILVSQKTFGMVWVPAGTAVTMGREILDNERNEVFKVVEVQKKDLKSFQQYVDNVQSFFKDF